MKRLYLFLTGVLLIHAILLGWIAYRYGPTWDEVTHLPSGISHWKFCDFTLYAVNPPLIRSIAALPVLVIPHQENWAQLASAKGTVSRRAEFGVGSDFVKANGVHSFFLYTIARWACIPFALLAAYICFRWACELYGKAWNMCDNCVVFFTTCPRIRYADLTGYGVYRTGNPRVVCVLALAEEKFVESGHIYRHPAWSCRVDEVYTARVLWILTADLGAVEIVV